MVEFWMGSTERSPRYTIYCHTHITSGRRYVSLTKKTMMARWNQHVSNATKKRGKGCRHFWAAIRKYGKDAFSHEVLEVHTDLDQANLAEEWFIRFFNTRDPHFGFNLKRGGTHVPHPVKNPWDRPGFRERQMEAVRRSLQDPECVARYRAAGEALKSNPEFLAKVKDPRSCAARSVQSRETWDRKRQECPQEVPIPIPAPAEPKKFDPNKLCIRCGKPGEFGRDKHTKTGFKSVCKACEREDRSLRTEKTAKRQKNYREANKDKRKGYQARYYRDNKKRIADRDSARRAEINEAKRVWRNGIRRAIEDAKGAPCRDCGNSYNPFKMALFSSDFKSKSIEWMVNTSKAKQTILDEISRRVVLCLDCYDRRVSASFQERER